MKFERTVNDPKRTMERVLEGLHGRLTLHENIQSMEVSISDTGTANTEIVIVHKLSRTPSLYLYNIDRAGIVYDSRRAEWTPTHLYVKCSVANAQVTLTIL